MDCEHGDLRPHRLREGAESLLSPTGSMRDKIIYFQHEHLLRKVSIVPYVHLYFKTAQNFGAICNVVL